MTHEEKAREIARQWGDDCCLKQCEVAIVEALASAEKNGYEKGREEEYEKSLIDLKIVVEEAAKQHILGWNEAISSAVKVAEDCGLDHEYEDYECCGGRIISKIEALRKG